MRRVHIECLPNSNKSVPKDELISLCDELMLEISNKFDVDPHPLRSGLINTLAEIHIDPDTVVGPMATSVNDFMQLFNAEAVMYVSPLKVKVSGIDIGGASNAVVVALEDAGFSGSVAVAYRNVLHPAPRPYVAPSVKRKLAKRQLDNHLKRQMTLLLERVKQYVPPQLVKETSE